jgi:hypothetical protein
MNFRAESGTPRGAYRRTMRLDVTFFDAAYEEWISRSEARPQRVEYGRGS